jgi:hypothetical protein
MEQLYEEALQQHQLILPIYKIGDLKVFVDLVSDVYNRYDTSVYLRVWSTGTQLYQDQSSNFEEFKQMVNSIQHLKFSVLYGKFYTTIPVDHSPLVDFPNVQLMSADCCVCLEKTQTKTACEHALCWICYAQLQARTCPLCRKVL